MAKRRKRKLTVKQVCICLLVVLFTSAYVMLMSEKMKPDKDTVEIHFVDVGQGDCSLIVSEDAAVLIDTGLREYSSAVISYILRYTDTLDYFVVTHPDTDHMGGAADVIDFFDVRNVIMSDCNSASPAFERLLTSIERSDAEVILAKAGQKYDVGGFSFTVLAPIGEYDEDISENDHSVVVKLEYGGFSALFMGDAESYEESVMLASYSADLLRSDVLKVAHHGSKSSSSSRFISAVSPSLAVISCGKDNEYGHPHKAVLSVLGKVGCEILRTDQDGTVIVVTDGNGFFIK